MFTGTTKLASAIHFCPIDGVTPPRPGDVNGDGTAGLDDVASILRIAGGLQTGLPGQVVAADFDGDGKLTVVDAARWAQATIPGHAGVATLSAANAYSNYGVYLDDPGLNGHPEARVLATHRYVQQSNPVIGVWYNALNGRWVVFNENIAPMASGETFNYYFGPDVKGVASAGSNAVPLSDPLLPLDAGSVQLAIHDWVANYNTSPVAVRFGGGADWRAFNENASPIATNERLFFADARFHGGVAALTAANAYMAGPVAIGLYLDDPRLNGNPNAILLAQHGYAAADLGGPLGVWYNGTNDRWVVYDESFAAIPMGEQVHYLIGPGS
jgi:hypothetical protein